MGPWLDASSRWRIQLLIGAVGVAVACVLGYGFQTGVRLNSVYAPLVDATMEIKLGGATAHLLIEEVLVGDPDAEPREIWAQLDRADRYAQAMLNVDSGVPERLTPLLDPDMRRKIRDVREKLARFRAVARERLQQAEVARAGSELDSRFDKLFHAYVADATEVGDTLKSVMARDLRWFRLTQTALIGASVLLSFLVGAAFLRYENRRSRDFLALGRMTERLKEQIAEREAAEEALREAHDQLEKRVQERTAELSASNELLSREIAERRLAEGALRDSENKLRLLSSHLLTAQEDERRRLSRELHDELGQSLAVMKLRLRSLHARTEGTQGSWKEDLSELLGYVDQTIENVHRVSKDLSPSIVEDLGLTAALRYRIEDFSRLSGIAFNIELCNVDQHFPCAAGTNVYRIFQEALTNIKKHSGASSGSVLVQTGPGCVRFCIRDDGKGFDPKELEAKSALDRGMGVAAMQERVRMLGGTFRIDSRPGDGTAVAFQLPSQGGTSSS